mmetsp:Transcript_13709/g.49873  ORF Transcript_13709/g.49873 Transcript_13709/m.49873 type:complete len:426 (-) Transcript_13709:12-1289(-)
MLGPYDCAWFPGRRPLISLALLAIRLRATCHFGLGGRLFSTEWPRRVAFIGLDLPRAQANVLALHTAVDKDFNAFVQGRIHHGCSRLEVRPPSYVRRVAFHGASSRPDDLDVPLHLVQPINSPNLAEGVTRHHEIRKVETREEEDRKLVVPHARDSVLRAYGGPQEVPALRRELGLTRCSGLELLLGGLPPREIGGSVEHTQTLRFDATERQLGVDEELLGQLFQLPIRLFSAGLVEHSQVVHVRLVRQHNLFAHVVAVQEVDCASDGDAEGKVLDSLLLGGACLYAALHVLSGRHVEALDALIPDGSGHRVVLLQGVLVNHIRELDQLQGVPLLGLGGRSRRRRRRWRGGRQVLGLDVDVHRGLGRLGSGCPASRGHLHCRGTNPGAIRPADARTGRLARRRTCKDAPSRHRVPAARRKPQRVR